MRFYQCSDKGSHHVSVKKVMMSAGVCNVATEKLLILLHLRKVYSAKNVEVFVSCLFHFELQIKLEQKNILKG